MTESVRPIAVPLMQAHQFVGCSRTQFKKVFVDGGLVDPVDMGGRGLSVIVAEVEDAVRKRAAMIRSGEIVPPVRSARGKKRGTQTREKVNDENLASNSTIPDENSCR